MDLVFVAKEALPCSDFFSRDSSSGSSPVLPLPLHVTRPIVSHHLPLRCKSLSKNISRAVEILNNISRAVGAVNNMRPLSWVEEGGGGGGTNENYL